MDKKTYNHLTRINCNGITVFVLDEIKKQFSAHIIQDMIKLPCAANQTQFTIQSNTSKGELFKAIMRGATYDHAIPLSYSIENNYPNGVWLYDDDDLFGRFFPTSEAFELLRHDAQVILDAESK